MLLLQSLQQFDIDTADFFIILATSGLLLFFTLAALAGPLVGFATQNAYRIRRKSFLDKCAMQISQSAFMLWAFVIFVCIAGAGLLLYYIDPADLSEFLQGLIPPDAYRELTASASQIDAAQGSAPQITLSDLARGLPTLLSHMLPLCVLLAAPLVSTIILAIYAFTWSALKKVWPVHVFIGLLTVCCTLICFFTGITLAADSVNPFLPKLFSASIAEILGVSLAQFTSQPFLPLFTLYLLGTGIAAACAFSQIWLIVRRFKADYGRDYYAFAMKYCAKTALISTICSILVGGAGFAHLYETTPPEFKQPFDWGIALIAVGLPLTCCLLWLTIIKSERPMRHKPGVFFACFFLCIAICAQLLMLANCFPMA